MIKRIGVILPPTNVACEAEFVKFVPDGFALHFNRVSRPDTKIERNSLLAMEATVERAARDLADLRPAAILYCCTSATFLAGGGQDEDAANKILKGSGVRGITTSSAVISALRALNLKRVFMVSPYMDDIVAGAISFLRYYDVEVPNNFSFKHRDSLENWQRSPEDLMEVVIRHKHLLTDVDGVFLACTNLRSMEAISDIEKAVGKPVVSSNSASLWRGLHAAGADTRPIALGELYQHSPAN
jgi:maleate isomerase